MSAKQDLNKVIANIKKEITKSFNNQQMQKIAAFAMEQIKERSRNGYGVDDLGGTEKKFPALSKGYIEQRKRSKLSPYTSATKSNITFSGRLLASLRFSTRDGAAVIKPTGTSRNGTPNDEVAGYLEDQGRSFLTLSKKQLDKLYEFIRSKIVDIKL